MSKSFAYRPNGKVFTKDEALHCLKLLIQDFKDEVEGGHLKGSIDDTKELSPNNSKNYQEESVKLSFISPLFELLNWNTSDNHEVKPEEYVSSGFIDYLFVKENMPQFVVEAKRPSEILDLNNSTGRKYAKQAIGYGKVVAGVNFAIVTDFEEFLVFHTYVNPPEKLVLKNMLFSLKWTDFIENFDKLWLFSKNEFDKAPVQAKLKSYIHDKAVIRSSKPVDESLLEDLQFWREKLAIAIDKSTKGELSLHDLSLIVQVILNRALFVRAAEDHKLIEFGFLAKIANHQGSFELFKNHCKNLLADRYNSSLFDKNSLLEKIDFEISDKVFGTFLLALYDRGQEALHDTYDFDIIPLDILGRTYEQYLGWHLVRNKGVLKLEEKPEVKHSGGVYYTPKYIVDYIVEQTIGKKLAEAEGNLRKINNIRVLDPACGSGTFLITAYDFLLKKYKEIAIKGKRKEWLRSSADGKTTVLDTELRREILRKHIFGVDIDPSAVEVTRLSLFLRFIKDELQVNLLAVNLLPNLNANIRCGNSLISSKDTKFALADPETIGRINSFDWDSDSRGFGELLKGHDKFSIIIGNPPYIRIQEMAQWYPEEVQILKTKYNSLKEGNGDLYLLFMEQCMSLLSPSGLFAFIQSNKFTKANYGEFIREKIVKEKLLTEFLNFRDQQVFDTATTYTAIFIIGESDGNFKYTEVYDLKKHKSQVDLIASKTAFRSEEFRTDILNVKDLGKDLWVFPFPEEKSVLEKMKNVPNKLGDFTDKMFQGFKTGRDSVYCLHIPDGELLNLNKKTISLYSEAAEENIKVETSLLLPLVKSAEMARYTVSLPKQAIIFPYESDGSLIAEKTFKSEYPLTWEYLKSCRVKPDPKDPKKDKGLLSRKASGGVSMDGPVWYGYSRTQALTSMKLIKLLTADIKPYASFAFDSTGSTSFNGGAAGGYGLVLKKVEHVKYFLSVLNSFVLDWYHQKFTDIMSGEFYGYEKRFIDHLPIPDPDKLEKTDSVLYRDLCANSDHLFQLYSHLNSDDLNSRETTAVQKSILSAEEENLKLVGSLYKLSSKEIKVVEQNYRGQIALNRFLNRGQ